MAITKEGERFVQSLSVKLEATHLSLEELHAVLVMLKHESLITNTALQKYMNHPLSDNMKSVSEIKNAFDSLHILLDRIDLADPPAN